MAEPAPAAAVSSAISPARETAYRILRRVETGGVFAVDLLQGAPAAELRDADRRLATELVMGALRWRGELDFQVERLSGRPLTYFDPEVAAILRLGIYQIRFLKKIPKRAVVNDSVELTRVARKRSASGLVNAVLRRCNPPEETHEGAPDPELDAAALRSLPAWLRERWEAQLGFERTLALARASVATPRVTLRVSAERRDDVRRELAVENVVTRLGAYSDSALVVESGRVQASAPFHQGEGRMAIQDEASQLVASLVRPLPGQRVLDLCAAPGIKTAQLAAALGRGRVVACDVSLRRLQTMRRLLAGPGGQMLAAVELLTVCQDAARPLALRGTFDRILVDAPCSGTGTLARNPEIKLRLQPSDLDRLADAQARMLRNALEALAPTGRLVYATCSLEPEENEEVIERVRAEQPGFRPLTRDELAREFPALAPLFDSQGYFRTQPDRDGMDGFFAAVIVRRGN